MNKSELKQQVEKFIENNKPNEALDLLEAFIVQSTNDYSDLSNTILLNKAELNKANQEKHNNTISAAEYDKKLMQINESILYILKEVMESENDLPNEPQVNISEIKSVIVDDESIGIVTLQHMLAEHCANVKIIKTFQSSEEAYAFIKDQKPDLLFLDIHMPHINGLELLSRLGYKNYNVIFTTAHMEYMLTALRLNAIDYLSKPIDKVDLISAVGRVEEKLNGNLNSEQISNALEQSQKGYHISQSTKFGIKVENIIRYVHLSEICYCKSYGNLTLVRLADNGVIHSTESLNIIQNRLPDIFFFRSNPAYLINRDHIQEFDELHYIVNMTDNENISISKDRRVDFKNFLKGVLNS